MISLCPGEGLLRELKCLLQLLLVCFELSHLLAQFVFFLLSCEGLEELLLQRVLQSGNLLHLTPDLLVLHSVDFIEHPVPLLQKLFELNLRLQPLFFHLVHLSHQFIVILHNFTQQKVFLLSHFDQLLHLPVFRQHQITRRLQLHCQVCHICCKLPQLSNHLDIFLCLFRQLLRHPFHLNTFLLPLLVVSDLYYLDLLVMLQLCHLSVVFSCR